MENGLILIKGLQNQTILETANEVFELEKMVWDKNMCASLNTIVHRLTIFSDGLWRLYQNNILVSYMYFIRLEEESIHDFKTWNDYSQNGTCNNCRNSGNIIFGVSIGANKKNMGTKIFNLGIDQILLGAYQNATEIRMCSRIPTLSKIFTDQKNVYLKPKDLFLLNDPVVKMILAKGFVILELCENGYNVDNESLGYCILMRRNINGNSSY